MRFLITAGPTREPIDPVRFLSNRSSGKMGYAVASAAKNAGHEVTLISGPVNLSQPSEVEIRNVTTAEEMFESVGREICAADVAIFSAAVADYRPVQTATQKIKKRDGSLRLELEPTRDILGAARDEFGFSGFLVGFAAETENLIDNASGKLRDKGCDLVVANDVSRTDIGFDSDDNAAVFCYPDGSTRILEKCPKRELAELIVRECERLASHGAPKA